MPHRPRMDKTQLLQVRVTKTELRAVHRYARANNQTASDLLRARVVNPALNYDPRQTVLAFEKGGHPHARTG